jgi:uncharacterized protein
MNVVSDATPISTLLKVDQAILLKKLFDTVIIPEAVSEELMAFHPQLPDFVRVQSVTARHRRLPGTEKLGKGEAEAILLAKEVGADILLTDDRKARIAAVSLNVRCTGLLGLLILAKQANHLESVTTMVEVLEKQGGLYLSPDVKVEAAKLAGEYQA